MGVGSNPRRKKKLKLEHDDGRWSDLPPDIVGLILCCLPRLDDRIRFSAVCKPWRSDWSQQPPSTLPLMVLTPNPNLKAFSFSDSAWYKIRAPEIHGARICGSFENWLVVAHRDRGNFLLNPFSRATIPLPHQSTMELEPPFPGGQSSDEWRRSLGVIHKAILSSSPTSSDSFVAAVVCVSGRLSICRPQSRTWARFPSDSGFEDVILYKGQLHAVDNRGRIFTVEVGNEQIKGVKWFEIQLSPHEQGLLYHARTNYLVESGERLLMVCRGHRGQAGQFRVLELQLGPSPRPRRWVEVKSLGGHALFIGASCSKSVPAAQCAGVEEDCIYFTDSDKHIIGGRTKRSFPCFDSGVFSMKDGRITPFFDNASQLRKSLSSRSQPLWLHFSLPQ